MRILFISNLYPPSDLGGLEQRCKEVAELLKIRGHKLQVLTSRSRHVKLDQGLEVTRSLFLQADLSYYKPMDFFLRHSSRERQNIQELRSCIDHFVPDVILIWGMWDLSRSVAFYAEKWLPGRVAYNIASYWPIEKNVHEEYWQSPAKHLLTEWLKRPLRKLALRQLRQEEYQFRLKFEHAFCASEYVLNRLKNAGVLPENSKVIYPGIDPVPLIDNTLDDCRRSSETLRLLSFGSLVNHKGVHTAIEAMGILKKRGLIDSIELTILGSGHPDYENHLRTLARNLDVDDRVNFVRKVPREEIPTWLKRFDIFLFTSIWPEPIAATVMEAMAAGLLVIGTEVGGQVEMLFNGKNSLTFKPEDAETLSDHIISMRKNWSMGMDLAREGQKLVLEKFTLERMVNEIEDYLTNIIRSN